MASLFASLASDLTFVAIFVVAEVVVLLSTWAAVALERHSRGRVLELAEEAGTRDLVAQRLEHTGAYELAVRLLRFLGSAVLVVGIAFLALHDHLAGPGPRPAAFPWGPLGAALGASFVLNFLVNDLLVRLLARRRPEQFLLSALPYLEGLRLVTLPIRYPLVWVAGKVFRMHLQDPGPTAREEVLESVEEGERDGSLTSHEADMIESIMDLGQATVDDVLTPRSDISMIPAQASLEEAVRFVVQDGHSRIPVYGRDRDDVVGVLYARDLLAYSSEERAGRTVADVMHPAFFVPEGKPLKDLLEELRTRKVHMAVVTNEFGGTAGLVTIEDILEEIVGEIEDEYDEEEEEETVPPVQLGRETLLVDGRTPIEEVNEALAVSLPVPRDFETVGGLVFHHLGKVPRRGDRLTVANVSLTVTEADERSARRVRVQVVSPPV